jgi:carbonic anhydrase
VAEDEDLRPRNADEALEWLLAGNVVAEDEAGSLEYGAVHLDVPLVVVLGHEGCGAVTAALGSIDDEPRELVTLLRRIRPALADIDRSLPEQEQIQLGVEANIRQSARQIEAIVAPHAHDRIKVVSALYDLDSGRVRILD